MLILSCSDKIIRTQLLKCVADFFFFNFPTGTGGQTEFVHLIIPVQIVHEDDNIFFFLIISKMHYMLVFVWRIHMQE